MDHVSAGDDVTAPIISAVTVKRRLAIIEMVMFEYEDGRVHLMPLESMSDAAHKEVSDWYYDQFTKGKGHTIVWKD